MEEINVILKIMGQMMLYIMAGIGVLFAAAVVMCLFMASDKEEHKLDREEYDTTPYDEEEYR